MNHKISKALSLALVLTVLLVAIGPAYAAGSTIVFEGMEKGFSFAPGTGYTDTDLFGNLKDVMPGNHYEEVITFTNRAEDCDYIRLYMRAEVHDESENPPIYDESFENADEKDQSNVQGQRDETAVTMSDFLAQLHMQVYNGEALIYESSPDKTAGLTENTFLGTYHAGEQTQLTVKLDVPAELGNEYFYRVGEIDWVFVAEVFKEPEPDESKGFLTVNKIWENVAPEKIPESVQVNLLKDGAVVETIVLDNQNQWTHTWEKLDKKSDWTVEELVPEGFTPTYITQGNLVTIVNTGDGERPVEPVEPVEPVSLTVRKAWSGDQEKLEERPDSVCVTLYNGTQAVETVYLGQWNDWQYTWEELDGNGQWMVFETDIPAAYVPSYWAEGNTVTITNTASLIDTGQLNWPIPVLFCLGLLLMILGYCMTRRKRENGHG